MKLWMLIPLLALSACAPLPPGTGSESVAQRRMNALRDKPPQLREFLQRMPKGGDIHNHLSGAIYAEHYIEYAAAGGLCISQATWRLSNPPCPDGSRAISDARTDDALRGQIVDAWSTRDFVPFPGWSEGDQFFSTFDRFGMASGSHGGTMLADVMRTSRAQGLSYLELMISPASSQSRSLGATTPWNDMGELTRTVDGLRANPELTAIIDGVRQRTDSMESQMRYELKCGSDTPEPACDMPVRYLSQVVREFSKDEVLGQMLLAFEMTRSDKRFVGLNLVGPEDGYVAMRDYQLHMEMLDHLHGVYPEVKIALHAGELTLGLVPPDDLTFHVTEAVEVGHASRIGHGVSIGYEPQGKRVMTQMAKQGVAVEILLTSNQQILGVEGADHPFQTYRSAGVVTVLATDDAGVSRSDITNEYQEAVQEQGLQYKDLKQMARDSLEYSFLAGPSLWKDAKFGSRIEACSSDDTTSAQLSTDCEQYLAKSDKASAQWRLEGDLARFELATPRKG